LANIITRLLNSAMLGRGGNLQSFEDPYQAVARLLRHENVTGILDAGASHGRVTDRFMRLFPEAQAYAFEPNPMYRDRLEARAAQDKNFHPQYYALSDKPGSLELHVAESPGITSLFRPSAKLHDMYPDKAREKQAIIVDVTTIDEWARNLGNPEIQFMKFDIQGGEVNALKGAADTIARGTKLIYTEILFNSLYDEGGLYTDIDRVLRDYGFQIYNIYKPRTDDQGRIMWANAIFTRQID